MEERHPLKRFANLQFFIIFIHFFLYISLLLWNHFAFADADPIEEDFVNPFFVTTLFRHPHCPAAMADSGDDGADEVKVFRKNDVEELGADSLQSTVQLHEGFFIPPFFH